MPQSDWPQVAVIGAGAVGCYFGGMLARAGAPVVFAGRPGKPSAHLEALERDGLRFDSVNFQEQVKVRVASLDQAVRAADIILLCVKTLDTESAAQQIAPHLKPGAVVVSLQNGVDNVERIRAAAGFEALAAVVYVAASLPGPGHLRHAGRGDLILGHSSRSADVQRIAAAFTRAGVPCRISENLEGDLWVKLIMNCAGNAISALAHTTYGRIVAHEPAMQVVMNVIGEAVAVARAAGIELPPTDLTAAGLKLLAGDLKNATSSTAQDIAAGRRTEIASLNGFIAARGAALAIPTPVNHTLFALVKLLEETGSTGS
jgi:2-dehydropantoate 2-reductase